MTRRIVDGVSAEDVRAAVALARLHGDGAGVVWTAAEWERVWVRLTPTQQHVVFLYVLVGLEQVEVAEQLGLTRNSVDGAWRRALVRLRDAIPSRFTSGSSARRGSAACSRPR